MPVCRECQTAEVSRKDARCPSCRDVYMKAYFKNHYESNKEHKKALAREYRANNLQSVKVSQSLGYQRHRAKRVAKIKEWQANNREKYDEHVRHGTLNRIARKRGAEGQYTVDDVHALGNRQSWVCNNPFCMCDIRAAYDVDHIVPLSRGGSNWPANLQLLCPSCNKRKHAKTMDEFITLLCATMR